VFGALVVGEPVDADATAGAVVAGAAGIGADGPVMPPSV